MDTARDKLGTRREVADRLGMSAYSVRRLVETGVFGIVWVGGRSYVLLADVERFERRVSGVVEAAGASA